MSSPVGMDVSTQKKSVLSSSSSGLDSESVQVPNSDKIDQRCNLSLALWPNSVSAIGEK